MEIIYSAKAINGLGKAKTRRFVNPSFFDKVEAGATDVYVNGDHPKVASAYKAAGVSVKPFSEHPSQKTVAKPAS